MALKSLLTSLKNLFKRPVKAKEAPVRVEQPSRLSFLGLPTEIRLNIYRLMPKSDLKRSTFRFDNHSVVHTQGFPVREFAALSRTCRFINGEVEEYLEKDAYNDESMIRINAANAAEYPQLSDKLIRISKLQPVDLCLSIPGWFGSDLREKRIIKVLDLLLWVLKTSCNHQTFTFHWSPFDYGYNHWRALLDTAKEPAISGDRRRTDREFKRAYTMLDDLRHSRQVFRCTPHYRSDSYRNG